MSTTAQSRNLSTLTRVLIALGVFLFSVAVICWGCFQYLLWSLDHGAPF